METLNKGIRVVISGKGYVSRGELKIIDNLESSDHKCSETGNTKKIFALTSLLHVSVCRLRR